LKTFNLTIEGFFLPFFYLNYTIFNN